MPMLATRSSDRFSLLVIILLSFCWKRRTILSSVEGACNFFYITGCYFDCEVSPGVDPTVAYDGVKNTLRCVAHGWGFGAGIQGEMQSDVYDCSADCDTCDLKIRGRYSESQCREDELVDAGDCLRLEGPGSRCCPLLFTTNSLSCSLHDTSYCGSGVETIPPETSAASCSHRIRCGLVDETQTACEEFTMDFGRCVDTQNNVVRKELGTCNELDTVAPTTTSSTSTRTSPPPSREASTRSSAPEPAASTTERPNEDSSSPPSSDEALNTRTNTNEGLSTDAIVAICVPVSIAFVGASYKVWTDFCRRPTPAPTPTPTPSNTTNVSTQITFNIKNSTKQFFGILNRE